MNRITDRLLWPIGGDEPAPAADVRDALLMGLEDIGGGPDGAWWASLGGRDWDEAPAGLFGRQWLCWSALDRARWVIMTGMRSVEPLPDGYETGDGCPRSYAGVA